MNFFGGWFFERTLAVIRPFLMSQSRAISDRGKSGQFDGIVTFGPAPRSAVGGGGRRGAGRQLL